MKRLTLLAVTLCLSGGVARISAQEAVDSDMKKVNEYLQNLAESERDDRTVEMQRVIDDMDRVCELDEAQRARLELAAKGAIDRGLDGWRNRMDRWVRDRVESAQGDMEQVLQGLGTVRFGESREWEAEAQDLWRDAVVETLSDPQRVAYRQDVEARLEFKYRAMSQVLVADLDRKLRFSQSQRDRVAELLLASARQYWDSLENWSGDEENLPYFQMSALLGGVPEEAVKEVLTEAQQEGWNAYFERAEGVWNAIRNRKKPVREQMWFE